MVRTGVPRSRAGRRRNDDDGIALITVVGTMATVTLLLFAVLAYVLADVRPARADQDSKAAVAAAQAGIDEYLARLTANDTYWTVGNNDPGNTALTSAVALPGASGAAGSFSYRVLNSVSNIASTGTIQLQVTGTSRPPSGRTVSRTLIASLKTSGFLSYLYFTDVESTDPQLWDTQATATASGVSTSGYTVYADPAQVDALCSRQYWNGRADSSYTATSSAGQTATVYQNGAQVGTIPGWNNTVSGQVTISKFCTHPLSFIDGDSVNGPMHTNDVPRIAGDVTFGGVTTVYWPGPDTGYSGIPVPHVTNDFYYRQSGGTPHGAPVFGAYRPMPSGDDQLLRYVLPKVDSDPNANRPGCLYSGATKILFHGATMDVTSPNSVSTTSTCLPQGPSATNLSVPVPPVIYVQGASAGTCTGVGYPASGEATTGRTTTDYSPCHGTAFISGTVGAQTTVGTADDIVITGDLSYNNPSGTDVLGLIADNDVWVYHPVDSSGSNLSGVPVPHNISAAILSLQHSFVVQNHDQGAVLSTLKITGSIAQKYRGAVGTFSTSNGVNTPIHGYVKNYTYDTRFKALQPPYFIKPLNTPWTLQQLSDG